MFAGIDVGGANTKIATSGGFVDSRYAPLWKNKEHLCDVLADVKQKLGTELEAVGAVMTGELSDCFETKREGVLYIKDILYTIFDAPKFFDRNCGFKGSAAVDKDPLSFASTNWLASAKLIAAQYKDGIFVDIGSTTTDVIPLVRGAIKAKRTDIERLKSGELIYSGVLRTNVAVLLRKVEIGKQGEECSVSSELFAITADAYLVLGYITENEYSCESPNSYIFAGREGEGDEKSRMSAMRRLSRVVCSDLEEIEGDGAVSIAEQVKRAQVDELITSLSRLKSRYGLELVIGAGIGDFIVQEAANSLNMQFISLSSSYGRRIAATFPAYAVAMLLEKEFKKKED